MFHEMAERDNYRAWKPLVCADVATKLVLMILNATKRCDYLDVPMHYSRGAWTLARQYGGRALQFLHGKHSFRHGNVSPSHFRDPTLAHEHQALLELLATAPKVLQGRRCNFQFRLEAATFKRGCIDVALKFGTLCGKTLELFAQPG